MRQGEAHFAGGGGGGGGGQQNAVFELDKQEQENKSIKITNSQMRLSSQLQRQFTSYCFVLPTFNSFHFVYDALVAL